MNVKKARNSSRRREGRRWCLKTVLIGMTLLMAWGAAGQSGALQRFAKDELSFDYPAGWTLNDESDAQSQNLTVKRGEDAQITVFLFRQPVASPEILTAVRTSIVAPIIERVTQNAGVESVERAPSRAEIGGVQADGERLSIQSDKGPASAEFYAFLLNQRLVIVSYMRRNAAAAEANAAWELVRRSLRAGAGAVAGVEPAEAGKPAPQTNVPLPSMAALDRAKALMDEFFAIQKQVLKLKDEGRYADALPLAERALAMAEKGVGAEIPEGFFNPMIATALNNLGELYKAKGDYDRAEPFYLRSLDIKEKTNGPEHQSIATSLNNLAALYMEKGDYDRAEPMLERTLVIFEKTTGAESALTALALNNLAQFYDAKNDYEKAEKMTLRSLAIREKVLGAEHVEVAISLNNLASIYELKGDAERAEQLYRRAIAIREKLSGPDHPDVATSLNNLALLYKHRGDYARAESLFGRSLAISEKSLGANHPQVALALDNLAQVFFDKGDYARAEALYQRSLSIYEKAFGAENDNVATVLNNLALLYQEREDFAQAEKLMLRVRAIFEKKFGAEHSLVATSLDNLAGLYRARREYDRAEPLFQRALVIREKLFGKESAEVAVSLNNIGSLHSARGDYDRAMPLQQRGLDVYEKIYGAEHPNVALFLNNISTNHLGKGDAGRAVASQMRGAEVRERNLALILNTGSEEQKRLYMRTLADENDYTTFLHAVAAPNDAQARRLALTTVLRRKGRVLDAMSDQIGALRRRLRPEDRVLLEQLSAARASLAALVLNGAGKRPPAQYQADVARLNAEVERLESAVSARSAEFRVQSETVTLESVQASLPADSALVELTLYRPYNVKAATRAERWGAPRYVAYVLKPAGQPVWVELGDAAEIDRAIGALYGALADPQSADVRQLGRALDERAMRPVRKLLGDTRRIFISPDGALNLVPFAAFVDEQNRYLVENYSITYLTSGRDLLRLKAKTTSREQPLIMADPTFDSGAIGNTPAATGGNNSGGGGSSGRAQAVAGDGEAGRRSVDFSSAQFARLPGTAGEARALGTLMPRAKVLTGAQATESALKAVAGPSVLHVATHGFFLPGVPPETNTTAAGARGISLSTGADGAAATTIAARGENPLLRSGLALAGANGRQSAGGEDGVLTALEAAGLDLWGTKLVVLSACETGVGEVKNGDGVYGLRRALVLAGSEAQVMSLWQVSDEATRDLMVALYKRLENGEGRTDALRNVQLEMIKSERQQHPFFWASFIQSGEWRRIGEGATSTK